MTVNPISERAWIRFLTLFGLTGIAVAQPLLSIFGENPEFFVFVNARRFDTIVFALLVIAVPPVVLFGIEIAARLGGPNWPGWAHIGLVAVLVYLFAIQLIADPSPPLLLALVATVIGGTAGGLYYRFGGFRAWTRILGVVPVIAGAGFLFWSPTGELFSTEAAAVAPADEILLVEEDEIPSIIFLVFDEFPTRTLLLADGTIDADRFPNFARLADESTWYPSHSTVSSRTEFALPAMVASEAPRDVSPLFTNYPNTMFRLFGDTHHLTVSESLTALCPPSQCGFRPIAPPPVTLTAEPAPAPVTPAAGAFRPRPLYERGFDVFFDRVLPGRDASGSEADFEETFTDAALAPTTATTLTPSSTAPDDPEVEPEIDPEIDQGVSVDDFAIKVRTAPGSQPARYQDMLGAIGPTNEPALWFLHLLLPHFPWRFHPGGEQYRLPSGYDDLDLDRSDAWVTSLSQTRHALQTQYLDGLLGEMLARFDEAGIYDDAVLVVVADHGQSFELEVGGRDYEAAVPSDVLYTPLFIKQPNQTEGVVDRANVSVLDILPTVAASVGVRIPWPVAGVDLASGAVDQRDGTKQVWRYNGEFEPRATGVLEFQQAELDLDLLRPGLPDQSTGPDPVDYGSLGEAATLVGESFAALTTGGPNGRADVVDRALIESPPAAEVPIGVVAGTIDGARSPDDAVVVIALDDSIVALSPIFTYRGQAQSFVALLPPEALSADASRRLDVGWWTPSSGLTSLELQ